MIKYFEDVWEGDGIIVEPHGSIGNLVEILEMPGLGDEDDLDIELGMRISMKSKKEWNFYWLHTLKTELRDFDRVFRVVFPGGLIFDYPESVIRKVIPFREFRQYHKEMGFR